MFSGQVNKKWHIIAILTVCFLLTALLAKLSNFDGPEVAVFHMVNNLPDSLRHLFVALTWFGSEWALMWLLLSAVLLKRYSVAIQMFLAGGFAYVAAKIIKFIVERPRPFEVVPDMHQYIVETGFGFPSAHTTFAAALSFTLVLVLGGHWKIVPWLWITAVGLSRIYLGVHMPLDVIGGVLLGAAVAFCVHYTRHIWHKKAEAFWLEIRKPAR